MNAATLMDIYHCLTGRGGGEITLIYEEMEGAAEVWTKCFAWGNKEKGRPLMARLPSGKS